MMDELIVNFTPTGMLPTKQHTPHVPLSVAEIVDAVGEAVALGITMVHLHAREPASGEPSCDPEVYGRLIEGVRRVDPQLVVCVSLSGRNVSEFDRRAAPLALTGALKPDMGSLTLSSLNFARQASVSSPEMVQRLAGTMAERGIVPELEVFDLGMANYAAYLQRKGLVRPPCYCNLLFGNIAGAQADPLHVGLLLRELPAGTLCSLAGLGDAQLAMISLAVACGHGVRVGLEDNIWADRARTRLATNRELLQRVHALAELHERPIMRPATLRERLALQAGDGRYGRAEP